MPTEIVEKKRPTLRSQLEHYVDELRDRAQRDGIAGRLSPAAVRQLVCRELSDILIQCEDSPHPCPVDSP